MAFSLSELFNRFRPQPLMVRDFAQVITDVSHGNNVIVSMVKTYHCIGLDWAIYNNGVANLTISIDGQPIDTVAAGGNRISNGIKYDQIEVASTTAYTLYVAGVKMS